METTLVCELALSAASGLVKRGSALYVVADDEHFLDTLDAASGRRTHRVALFGDAVTEHGEDGYSKATKPDFEALTSLPDGRLLAVGSGSTPARERGVLVLSGDAGSAPVISGVVDLRPLYARLRAHFGELNIEGATLVGDVVCLLQRGCHGRSSGLVLLDAARVTRALARGVLDSDALVGTHAVDVGALDGVGLSLTDACALSGETTRLAFTAAAEDTSNAYDDGACVGSIVGEMNLTGHVERTSRVAGAHKIEGLAVEGDQAWLVADPDDRAKRAPLLRGAWPWPHLPAR